ncbi:MAG TPA: dTDP-4-dehydrorhamnose reductase [Bacteroidetes bacterium]|nr:dTDP-4-dehydrorhamnose reductase [Bacteroidota bacterium]
MKQDNKYLWVTGAGGQLGKILTKQLAEWPERNPFYTDLPELDITRSIALRKAAMEHPPALVVNTAGYTAVDRAESEPEKANAVNGKAVEQVSMVCQAYDAWLIHISTDYVFDGKKEEPWLETDHPNPISAYGYSKWIGEQAVLKNPRGIVLRTSWLYSAEGKNFVTTILDIVEKRSEVKVVSDQVGSPTLADDLAKVIALIVQKIRKNSIEPGIYHYANSGSCSWYEFAVAIMEAAGLPWRVIPIPSADFPQAARRPAYSVLNTEKIRKVLNIEIPYWKDSLNHCVEKIMQQQKRT